GDGELPEAGNHVATVEVAVVQHYAPHVGIAGPTGTHPGNFARSEVARKGPRHIERDDTTVVVRGIEDLAGLVHPEVVDPGALQVIAGDLGGCCQVGDVDHMDTPRGRHPDIPRPSLPDEQVLLLAVGIPEPPAIVGLAAISARVTDELGL